MTVPLHADSLINRSFRPEEIRALNALAFDVGPSKNDPASGHVPFVHDDKPTRGVDLIVVVHGQRRTYLDRDFRYLVLDDRESESRKCIQRSRVDHPVDRYQLALDL